AGRVGPRYSSALLSARRQSSTCYAPFEVPAALYSTPPPPAEIYTLSLHDALPIWITDRPVPRISDLFDFSSPPLTTANSPCRVKDRKSTRLNSSHGSTSYAVFCLKKNTGRHIAPVHGHSTATARESEPTDATSDTG